MVFKYTHDQKYLLKWDIVRTFYEFKLYVEKNDIPEIISFDHDLGDEYYDPDIHGSETYSEEYDNLVSKNGYDCAKWLINYCIDNNINPPKKILIHSANESGSLDIKSIFDTYNKVFNSNIEIKNFILNE